jgi:Ca2+-binding EF-hand superfamily protein
MGLDLAPSAAALAPSSVLGQGRAFFLQGLRSSSKSAHDISCEQEAKTCQLALRYRLSLSEAKRITKEFQNARKNQDGGLDRKEFDQVMCRIFDVPAVDDPISHGAYTATGMAGKIDIELFFNWYVQNMFTQVNSLNCAKDKVDSEKLIYEIARKHGVSTLAVDKVKVKFDHFDTDKSGHIDFEEFQDMFCTILKTKSRDELNPERMKRFWKEIDINGDEGVDFSEFAEWYLKYFHADNDTEDFDMNGPLRAFYDSYDPRVQRRQSLNAIEKHASID